MAGMGTEHSVTTVRFQEAEFHWPLFGNEFEEVTVASVPLIGRGFQKQPFGPAGRSCRLSGRSWIGAVRSRPAAMSYRCTQYSP